MVAGAHQQMRIADSLRGGRWVWRKAGSLWMDQIRSHHFETVRNHCVLAFSGDSPETRDS